MLRNDLVGAIVYYDGQQNDARTNVMLALTAAEHGAVVANYTEVVGFEKDADGKIAVRPFHMFLESFASQGARVVDRETGKQFTVKARGVVNAAGPYVDIVRKMDDPKSCADPFICCSQDSP